MYVCVCMYMDVCVCMYMYMYVCMWLILMLVKITQCYQGADLYLLLGVIMTRVSLK